MSPHITLPAHHCGS